MITRILARLVLVPLGVLIAGLVGAFVVGSLGLERLTLEAHRSSDITGVGGVAWSIFRNWESVGRLLSAVTLVPVLLLLVVGEVARLRSAMYYVLGGGLSLGIIPVLANVQTSGMLWQVFATGGFAAGFVYWLIAGRSA